MKQMMNLIALIVMLSVNVLTPISYAQEGKEYIKDFGKISEEYIDESQFDDEEEQVEEEQYEEEDVAEMEGIIVTLIKDVNHPEEKELVVIGDKGFDYMSYSRRQVQDGVEFADWYDNANLQGEPFDYNYIKGDITLYAKWTKKIVYQNGVIKISDGKKSISVKSVNEGGNVNDANKFRRIMEMENNKNYCHYEQECVSDSRSCYDVFVCTPSFFGEASNILGNTVKNLDQINNYFTSLYGNYYFRGNNGYAKYDELIPVENGYKSEVSIDQNAQDRGFLNYSKIFQPDIGWKENDISKNPCDITKGEYLPTPEDWEGLIDIWNDINGMYIGKVTDIEKPTEVYPGSLLRAGSVINGSSQIGNSLIFQQDLLITKAGRVVYETGREQDKFMYYNFPSLLWTSISNEGRSGWFDIEKGVLYWGDVDYSAYPIRCFVVENPVTVEFNTNGGSSIESYKVSEGKTIKAPDVPVKGGYTFEGWYKDSKLTQQWNFDKDIIEGSKVTLYAKWRTCGEGFMVKNNVCVPDDIEKKGIIMVSDGINTMFIKDKNVGAESKCSSELYQLMELSETRCPTFIGLIGGGEGRKGLSKGSDSTCLSDEDFFTQVNSIVKNVVINTNAEFNNYINLENQKCSGKYYFRGNNSGVNYGELSISGSDKVNPILNVDELIESGFNGGKLGTQEGSGWEQGNFNNPCDISKGEYLPTPDDWANLMRIWAKNNGYEVLFSPNVVEVAVTDDPIDEPWELEMKGIVPESNDSNLSINEGGNQSLSSIGAGNQFYHDLLMPNAGSILHECRDEDKPVRGSKGGCIDEMTYNVVGNSLWTALNKNGYVGIFDGLGVIYDTFGNLLEVFKKSPNDMAIPVRCFVNLPEVLVVTLVSDGKIDREINVVKGEVLKEPKLSVSDAVFEGWYTESGKKYDFNTPITEDIKLYAKWVKNKGDYSGGGGKGTLDSSKINNEKSDVLSSEKNIKYSDLEVIKGDLKNTSLGDSQDSSKINKKITTEFKEAYSYAKQNGVTTKTSVEDAKMYSSLTRIQMAKMLSNYAINVLGQEPDISKGMVKFNDVTSKMDKQYDDGVTLAYQLGIMGINMTNNNFRPNDIVTRAEFVSAFSRMLYGTSDGEYESTRKYYTNHMQKLKEEGIVSDTNPNMKELRGYVMIMLMRSASKGLF